MTRHHGEARWNTEAFEVLTVNCRNRLIPVYRHWYETLKIEERFATWFTVNGNGDITGLNHVSRLRTPESGIASAMPRDRTLRRQTAQEKA